jgi:predicted GNAT family acetyltransferase
MRIEVVALRDPREARAQVHEFLAAEPSHHNLALSILAQSCEHGLAGRFWIARAAGAVTGFAMQSPPGMRAVLARMDEDAARAIAEAVDDVPGAQGDAAVAAAFAGRYTLRNHVAVTDVDPGRLYELTHVEPVAAPPGVARLATSADHELVTAWVIAFGAATGDPAATKRASAEVAYFISLGGFWLWDDDGPACIVGVKPRAAGVARIGPVYTPPEHRGHGYATACVAHVSGLRVGEGLRCVLYTQLSNPTANAIYHRIGYRPIAEVLSYGFG